MSDTVNVTWIVDFIKQHNQFFKRDSIYAAIDKGELTPQRNPGATYGHYQFTIPNACSYIDKVLEWPQGQALLLQNRHGI